MFKSIYRFPYNFTRDYLRPRHWLYGSKHYYQRMKRGWSDHDSTGVGIGNHVVQIIREALPQHLNTGNTYTIYLLPEDFHACDKEGEECQKAQQRWDDMVTGIVEDLKDFDDIPEEENTLRGKELVEAIRAREAKEDAAVQRFTQYYRYFWN